MIRFGIQLAHRLALAKALETARQHERVKLQTREPTGSERSVQSSQLDRFSHCVQTIVQRWNSGQQADQQWVGRYWPHQLLPPRRSQDKRSPATTSGAYQPSCPIELILPPHYKRSEPSPSHSHLGGFTPVLPEPVWQQPPQPAASSHSPINSSSL